MIQAASNLKAIGRAGTGIDNIDLKVATSKGIPVIKYDYNIMLYIVTLLVFFCSTPAANSISAAEHTCAMMAALAR